MIPPPIFFANNAAAILIPSELGKDDINDDFIPSAGVNASIQPNNVPNVAIRNDPSNDPHCFNALPLMLVPSNNNGVANVNEVPCRNVLAEEPPGGNIHFHCPDRVGIQLTLDRTNVNAIAVTGAPSNLPINVVLPNSCANDAVNDNAAIFPQLFVLDMMDDDARDVLLLGRFDT